MEENIVFLIWFIVATCSAGYHLWESQPSRYPYFTYAWYHYPLLLLGSVFWFVVYPVYIIKKLSNHD